jgi:hypothetical protein
VDRNVTAASGNEALSAAYEGSKDGCTELVRYVDRSVHDRDSQSSTPPTHGRAVRRHSVEDDGVKGSGPQDAAHIPPRLKCNHDPPDYPDNGCASRDQGDRQCRTTSSREIATSRDHRSSSRLLVVQEGHIVSIHVEILGKFVHLKDRLQRIANLVDEQHPH